ncbi:GPI transamidase subunit PIG-U [Mycena floridula]|nr:GPI transamidase subunit PIG-U [Mycena floridula]
MKASTSWLEPTVVLPCAAVSRFLLASTRLPEILRHNQQLSSPLTSFFNLQEGIYLFKNGIDPYSGGVFRHSPLYLSLFATIIPNSAALSTLIWTAFDLLGAYAMIQIWRARQRVSNSQRDGLVAAAYLLNPYILLPGLALSTSSFETALALVSLMFACQGNASGSLLIAALLMQLSLSSVLLVVPLLLLLITDPVSHLASPHAFTGNLRKTLPLIGRLAFYSISFTLASTVAAGSFAWIPQTWGASLTLPDLTPNTGVWWYFFTEMFDHFRPFFLMVFSVHLLIYIVPICIKFQYDPLYAAFLLVGVMGTFKSYPTLSDPGLFLSMISLFPEIYPYFRHPIVTTFLHLHAALLLPLFHHIWLSQGTGNANFFYASTLVFACANGAALIDCIWAGLRIAIGPEQEGYSVTQE